MENRVVLLLAFLFGSRGAATVVRMCALWLMVANAVRHPVRGGTHALPLFGSSNGDSYTLYGSVQSGWADAGKFLTGATAVAAIAIPSVLAHAQIIQTGAMLMELCAALLLGATVLCYDYFSTQDAGW